MRAVIAGLALSTLFVSITDRRFATVATLGALTCAAVTWFVVRGDD